MIIVYMFIIFITPSSCVSCSGNMYLNICGHCVGGFSNVSDNLGIDLCGICDGDNSCLSCDEIVNGRNSFDECGVCLPATSELRNNCLKINSVYPSTIDSATNIRCVILTIFGGGLHAGNIQTDSLSCSIIPNDSQSESPKILDLTIEDDDLELKVDLLNALGIYTIFCENIDGSAIFTIVNSKLWKTFEVVPSHMNVDNSYELELKVEGPLVGMGEVWCFVRCENSMTSYLQGIWFATNSVKCSSYTPRVTGICTVGISATEEAVSEIESSEINAQFKVYAPVPVVVLAEYDPDLLKIIITFDVNIQLSLACSEVFDNVTLVNLDSDKCSVNGNLLSVKLKSNSSKLLRVISIREGNGIRRAGSNDSIFSPECSSTVIVVSHSKVLPPALSLSIPSVVCHPVEEFRVSNFGNQKLIYSWFVGLTKPPGKLGTQRENLMIWQNARDIQEKLNKKTKNNTSEIESSELIPENNYQIKVKGENMLGEEQIVMSGFRLSNDTPISATVTVIPGTNCLFAEVNITQCIDTSFPLSFNWFLNGTALHVSGHIAKIQGLEPGIYNLSCTIKVYGEERVLTESWALSQVLPSVQRIVLFPEEQLVGTMDTIVISASDLNLKSISWTCVLAGYDNIPCIAVGPSRNFVEHLIRNNSTVLVIPAGVLPVGKYVWRLRNHKSTNATVVVLPGIPPRLTTSVIPSFVNPLKALRILGEARRLVTDCLIYWKTVRRIGFNYFNLIEDTGLGYRVRVLPGSANRPVTVPLVIPSAQGNWLGLMSEASYLLRFLAVCPNRTSVHVDTPIVVNVPPIIEKITVNPESGIALITKFTVRGGEARDILEDFPLLYRWSYREGRRRIIVIDEGITARCLQFILPPGNITIILEVCDVHYTCMSVTSNPIIVSPPDNVTQQILRDLKLGIATSIVEKDIIKGLGNAIVVLKTLNTNKTFDSAFYEFSSTIELLLKSQIDNLIKNIKFPPYDSDYASNLLYLLRSSVIYFSPNSTLQQSINQLEDTLIPKRLKRQVTTQNVNLASSKIAVQEALNSNLEMRDVNAIAEFIPRLCTLNGSEIIFDAPKVSLWVSKPITFEDLPAEFFPKGRQDEFIHVKINRRDLPLPPVCLIIVKYNQSNFKTSFTDEYPLSDVFELLLTTNSKILPKKAESKDTAMAIKIPFIHAAVKFNCSLLTLNKWKIISECRPRDFGLFALTSTEKPESTSSTSMTTTKATTTVTTSISAITSTRLITTTTEKTTSEKSSSTSTTTIKPEFLSTLASNINASEVIVKVSFAGAVFKIDENFDYIVGNMKTEFENNLKNQFSNKFNISPDLIYVSVSPGSVIVTLYFLELIERERAAQIIEMLSISLQNEKLELYDINRHKLSIPKQNLTLVLPPPENSSKILRTATYVVGISVFVGVTILAVSGIIVNTRKSLSARKSKIRHLEPNYMIFSNQYSLEGSDASLTKYSADGSFIHL